MRILFIPVLAGLICTFALASSASAVERKNLPTRPPAAIGKAVQLTEEECKTQGGEVLVNNVCASGSVCATTDEHQKEHRVCISSKK
jgi:hypothetical protein